MKSIRTRVLLLFALCLSVVGTFGFLTYASFHSYSETIAKHDLSHDIVDRAIAIHHRFNGDTKSAEADRQALSKIAETIQPAFRATAIRDLVKNARSSDLQVVLRAEDEFRRYNQPLIQYFKHRAGYFGIITLAASLVFILGLTSFSLNLIFSPLRDLSNKMSDFVDNRYSYEFSVPEMNEVGMLHAKFNTMAQKVLTQIEELQSLDKAKTEFLSIASHELRTPLTSIKGSLKLLNSGVTGAMNPTATSLMTIALDETERLIRIINELLDLAKIEARQFPLNCDWVWTRDLIGKTFASLDGFCRPGEVKLVSSVMTEPEVGSIDLHIDFDRMQQVLTNLLSNAIKYSPKGGTVTVQLIQDSDEQIRIEVRDKGRGIAPEDQELIFEKFRQATSAQNPLVKGTGLGLTIAKALVEQHGGTIGVRSTPGEGSTFFFTLPKWRLHRAAGVAS